MTNLGSWILFGFCILTFGFSTIVGVGCGQQQETATTTTTYSTTTTTQPAAATVRLSGVLNTGTIASSIRSFSAASAYKVVAINNNTGQTYYSSADASGSFSVDIPGGVSYEVSLIDDNAKYFGPIVMVGNTSSSEVIMGVKPNSDTNLGQITIDTTNSYAKPTSEPVSIANLADKAEAANGKPKGAGNHGKNTLSGVATKEGADMDKDGIPNIFDGDENNDGIWNGIASIPTAAKVISATVESVQMNSNIWALHGISDEAKDIIHLRLHVYPKSGHGSEIQSVQCVSVPASIKDTAIIWDASSLGSPESYPAQGTLWKDASYNLYKTTTLTPQEWIVLVIPKAIMSVGDTFTVRVTYTSGGYQDFFVSTAYVLTDWSKIVTYNGNSMPTAEGTMNNPLVFSTPSLEVTFSKPKDETESIIKGLRYSIQLGTGEVVPANVTEVPITDTGAATLSYTLSTVTAETYYVTPVAESADGQRNGEQCWFRKL